MYEESAVRPNANLKLFITALLKYPSEFFCWYIVVVKVEVTEAILSARMNYFNISTYHHYIISTFRHFDILTFRHFTVSPF